MTSLRNEAVEAAGEPVLAAQQDLARELKNCKGSSALQEKKCKVSKYWEPTKRKSSSAYQELSSVVVDHHAEV
eukprot:1142912-Pelagomonas_calceolata.AAC.19